jgi:hypothetical protein
MLNNSDGGAFSCADGAGFVDSRGAGGVGVAGLGAGGSGVDGLGAGVGAGGVGVVCDVAAIPFVHATATITAYAATDCLRMICAPEGRAQSRAIDR